MRDHAAFTQVIFADSTIVKYSVKPPNVEMFGNGNLTRKPQPRDELVLDKQQLNLCTKVSNGLLLIENQPKAINLACSRPTNALSF